MRRDFGEFYSVNIFNILAHILKTIYVQVTVQYSRKFLSLDTPYSTIRNDHIIYNTKLNVYNHFTGYDFITFFLYLNSYKHIIMHIGFDEHLGILYENSIIMLCNIT